MQLSNTAYVILGFLDATPRSGYEIKQAVDTSTRFFWAASYGQIYPELKRLEAAGLVTSERDDTSGRKRTVHRLTPAGRKALRAWLAEPAADAEFRDEKLLKLFFSGSAGPDAPERGADALAARAAEHRDKAATLREIEPKVLAGGNPYQLAVLRYGIALNEWGARYCADAASDLGKDREETA
jgi:PadR family transcriptional regulator, regulatory protein AphA